MTAPDRTGITASAAPTLNRDLGLFEVVVYGVGLILGAGIYAILGEAAGVAGEALPISFVIAAAVASFTGLSYAELASRYPRGEGDYVYVRRAFGSKRLAEVVAFLRVFVGAVSAAVALAFAGYLDAFPPVPAVPTAIGVIALASVVNFWGIDVSATLNLVFTAAEIAGLAIVIWLGRTSWGSVNVLDAPFGVPGVVEAAFLVFFAYLGFGSIVTVAEETENPPRTVPMAIVLSIGATTVLYVLVAVSAIGVVNWRVLGESASPLAIVARTAGGDAVGAVVAAIALASTANTVLILLVSTSRLVYGVSKSAHRSFPAVFSRVHPGRQTPYLAVALVAGVTIPVTLLGDLGYVAGLANVGLLVVFVLVNAALLKLRYDDPGETAGFTAPLTFGRLSVTALAGVTTSLALLVFYVSGFV